MKYLQYKINLQEVAFVLDELSLWSSRFGHILFDNLDIRAYKHILDIGCATGFPLFELAHTFGPDCDITGIDIWKDALEKAREKQKIYDLPNVRIIEQNAQEMSFAKEEFDLIVSNLGINNFDNPQQVLLECYRVAKKNATLVITTNLKGHMKPFYNIFAETLRDLRLQESLEKLQKNEDHRGTSFSVSSLLENVGFKIVKKIEDNFSLRFLNSKAFFRHYLVKCGFLESWLSIVPLEEQQTVFSILETKLDSIAREQGEIKMPIPMLYLQAEKL
ncbi:class I SAM-dependent methyltransferase [Candidatus Uabimicrobium sp. HlEnr_7]|uniref:class I SAM-dependent methyltransferase n=1 Tax=Candidatus Uabimicrobium helgolandensis TaxID=3095367 RepID=UPI0035564514